MGPILAKKLVGRFGADVLLVIEKRPSELQTVVASSASRIPGILIVSPVAYPLSLNLMGVATDHIVGAFYAGSKGVSQNILSAESRLMGLKIIPGLTIYGLTVGSFSL
jgi:hypothetical protein